MKFKQQIVASLCIAIILLSQTSFSQALYQKNGTDKSFNQLLNEGTLRWDQNNNGPINGSTINVRNGQVERGLYGNRNINANQRLHVLCNRSTGSINNFKRWYQIDGKTEVFRLFKDEDNTTCCRRNAPRVEAFSVNRWGTGQWYEFSARFTLIKIRKGALFQSKFSSCCWSFQVDVLDNGNLVAQSRQVGGGIRRVTVATNMEGKSFDMKFIDNGADMKLFIDGSEVFSDRVTGRGSGKINTARWGLYSPGSPMSQDILVFVSGTYVGPELDDNSSNSNIFQLVKRNASDFAIDGGNGGANGREVYLWGENSNNQNQQWEQISRSGGFISLRKKNTNYCLDGGNGGQNGQAVTLRNCGTNNQNQHWKKISAGGGNYRLEKRNASGFSIDGGNGGSNSQKIKLWSSNHSNQNQHWKFNGVSSARKADSLEDFEDKIVFPNPSQTGVFQLKKPSSWRVLSITGKQLRSGNGNIVDISDIQGNLFLLEIGEKMIKLIK